MSWLRPFWIAMQLLTRLPVPDPRTADATMLGRSLLYYPLVGALLGALLAAAGWSLQGSFGALPLAAVLLALWVALTGALHLDGLADSADGWLGGYGDRDRTLAIMRDPRTGPAGVVAVVLVLLLKFAALTVIVEQHLWTGLVCIPLLARTLALLLFLTTPCARREGMAAGVAAGLPRPGAWFVVASAVALFAAPAGPWALLGGLLTFVATRALMLARIDGLTGDTTGALVELSETVALLMLPVTLRGHAFW